LPRGRIRRPRTRASPSCRRPWARPSPSTRA
jgi:hypothetical protein